MVVLSQARARFPGDVVAPMVARRIVQALCGAVDSVSCEAVLVVVSELVTSAVRAQAGAIELGIEVGEDGTVHLQVADDVSGWPIPRHCEDDSTGRGLMFIDALTQNWGSSPQFDVGKTVWAVLAPAC
jgi:hypothetical protein